MGLAVLVGTGVVAAVAATMVDVGVDVAVTGVGVDVTVTGAAHDAARKTGRITARSWSLILNSVGQAKRPQRLRAEVVLDPGPDLFSQGPTSQVSSALVGLTAVFGMGTGVTPPLQGPRRQLYQAARVVGKAPPIRAA